MAMVPADGSSQSFGGLAAQISWFGLRVGGHPALSLHSSNEPGEISQWLCHDDSTMNIISNIIIILQMRSIERGICPIVSVHNERTVPITYDRMHGACTKRLYFHFRSKIWRHHRVPRPRFPKPCKNYGDSRTFQADIGLLNICMGFQDLLA